MPFSDQEKKLLLDIARRSIEHGLEEGNPLPIDPSALPANLMEPRATFVSLHRHGKLRGCVGVIEACRPLAADVAHSAFFAAFMDHRFRPLRQMELVDLDIEISALSPSEPIDCRDENDLIRRLRPGIDGLNIEDGDHRATFLPVMWGQLPDPGDFLRQLKVKAGLPPYHWSKTFEASRFTAELIDGK